MLLQEKLTERTKLLSQLEQAKMQETVSASLSQMSELAAPKNTPSLEEVRDKIEKRYATALGQADLAQNSVSGRMLDVRRETINLQGSARLDEIRASLAAEQADGGGRRLRDTRGRGRSDGDVRRHSRRPSPKRRRSSPSPSER